MAIGEIWWQALEDIIASQNAIAVVIEGETELSRHVVARAQKHAAYDTLYWRMRKMPEPDRVALIRDAGAPTTASISTPIAAS